MVAPRNLVPLALVGVAVLSTIASAYLFGMQNPVGGATLLLTSQFFFALRLIHGSQGLRTGDIQLPFVIFYFLYSSTAAWLALLPTGKEVYPGLEEATLLGALGLGGYNLGLLVLGRRRPALGKGPARWQARIHLMPPAALAIGLLAIVAYSISNGIDVSFGGMDRARTARADIGQGYVILRLALIGVCNYVVLSWRRMGTASRVIVSGLLASYVTFYVMLGNRRDFLPLLLAAICVYSLRREHRLNLRAISLGVTMAALFLAMGVLREHLPGSMMETIVTENELTVPIQITAFYAEHSFPLRFGESYLRLPAYLVPRSLWSEKPTSLSIQFLMDSVGRTEYQGFAYNPVAEAFVNFGFVGPAIAMFFFALILNWIASASTGHFVIYVCCYSMVADFQRGEFTLTLYQLLIVCGTTLTLTAIERYGPALMAPSFQGGPGPSGSLSAPLRSRRLTQPTT